MGSFAQSKEPSAPGETVSLRACSGTLLCGAGPPSPGIGGPTSCAKLASVLVSVKCEQKAPHTKLEVVRRAAGLTRDSLVGSGLGAVPVVRDLCAKRPLRRPPLSCCTLSCKEFVFWCFHPAPHTHTIFIYQR